MNEVTVRRDSTIVCSLNPKLTHVHFGLQCSATRKTNPEKGFYTYIQSLECARLVDSGKTEPRTHVFDVELGNICEYFPLFGADFVLR